MLTSYSRRQLKRLICSNFDSLCVFVQIKATNYCPFTTVLTDEDIKLMSYRKSFQLKTIDLANSQTTTRITIGKPLCLT